LVGSVIEQGCEIAKPVSRPPVTGVFSMTGDFDASLKEHLGLLNHRVYKKSYDPRRNKMTTVTYTVPAISCGHCTHTIETEVGELQGVQSVKADESSKKVVITFDAPASEDTIKALLAEINYPAEGLITL